MTEPRDNPPPTVTELGRARMPDLAPPRSPTALALGRFRRNRTAMVGLGLLAVIAAACLYGLATHGWAVASGETPAYSRQLPRPEEGTHPLPPSREHPFGTDTLGRDMLHRTLLGGCISLAVGLAAATISVVIGTLWGVTAGYFGRGVDTVMMRIVDVFYGLPYILLVILLLVLVSGGGGEARPWYAGMWTRLVVLFGAIGAVSWLTMARIVRGQALALRESEFIQAARALGSKPRRIVLREMLPNLAGTILVCATLTVPLAILQESFLSFLGLGVKPPLASWGTLASKAVGTFNPIETYWWLLAMPCAMLGLALLALNFVGDGLRDAFDPRYR